MTPTHLGWGGIARLGLVQAGLGAVVVLTTSTLNRVMVVELALPALLPGLLVAIHYLLQVLRPRMGFGSDVGGRRTPWIVGGMSLLALGGITAATATAWMASQRLPGIALALVGFVFIGVGVSACGTSLLVLLAKRVAEPRRAAAATIVWLMMIAGMACTAGFAGKLLEPFSATRLLTVATAVSALALTLTLLALWGLEGPGVAAAEPSPDAAPALPAAKPAFREALAQVWAEPAARQFTLFIFVSMLAYSAQELILDPFAGLVFGYTPGQSTSLSGVQHGGALAGMLLAAAAGGRFAGRPFGSLRTWAVGGCLASALALLGLVAAGIVGPGWPFKANVFALGVANGAFAIAAIGSMMSMAGEGRAAREGVRIGLWGAAQAVAFGLGGVAGAGASDLFRWWLGQPASAYGAVFALEALLFVAAAAMAAGIGRPNGQASGASADPARALRPRTGEPSIASIE